MYNYFINKAGLMEIYKNGKICAELSGCENMQRTQAERLFNDVIFELERA